MHISDYLATESTTLEFKETLNTAKPKNWLKTISAFANTEGGTLIIGVSDKKEFIGVTDIQKVAAKAAELINAHIEPAPYYQIHSINEDGKDYLIIRVYKGVSTPYYYTSSGTRVSYTRMGDESIMTPQHILHSLILQGMNQTYDALPSQYYIHDVSFTYLNAAFRRLADRGATTRGGGIIETSNRGVANRGLTEKDLESFGLANPDGRLTNAGALLCDQYVVGQARIFCTRWKNATKGTVGEDALDDKEYEGNILVLLENAEMFVKNNSRKSWGVTGMFRDEYEEYPIAAVREALINAIIHRDYGILGSEIHIDMYPDRLEIVSPGGMVDGSRVQSLNIADIPSMRRNRVISDIFSRLEIMERRGSGLTRIMDEYANQKVKPEFYSETSFFRVTLPKLDVVGVADNLDTDAAVADTTATETSVAEVDDTTVTEVDDTTVIDATVTDIVSVDTAGNLNIANVSDEPISYENQVEQDDRVKESVSGNDGVVLPEVAVAILERLSSDPKITIPNLSKDLDLSEWQIRYVINYLKREGIVERVGGRKDGNWKIVRQ